MNAGRDSWADRIVALAAVMGLVLGVYNAMDSARQRERPIVTLRWNYIGSDDVQVVAENVGDEDARGCAFAFAGRPEEVFTAELVTIQSGNERPFEVPARLSDATYNGDVSYEVSCRNTTSENVVSFPYTLGSLNVGIPLAQAVVPCTALPAGCGTTTTTAPPTSSTIGG